MQHSDNTFPAETKIYYGFPSHILLFFLGALAAAVVAFLGFYFQETDSVFPAAMMSLFLIALGVWELRRRKVGQPQIVLNARGIQLAGHDFAEWQHIKNERVASPGYVLAFTNKGQSISFPIFDLKVEVETLEKMLVFYRKASLR